MLRDEAAEPAVQEARESAALMTPDTGTTLLGYLAATCTTVAFVPQLARIVKTRSTRDISLGMFVVITTGVLLWFIYGLMIHDMPVIVANGVTFLLTLAILVLKIRA